MTAILNHVYSFFFWDDETPHLIYQHFRTLVESSKIMCWSSSLQLTCLWFFFQYNFLFIFAPLITFWHTNAKVWFRSFCFLSWLMSIFIFVKAISTSRQNQTLFFLVLHVCKFNDKNRQTLGLNLVSDKGCLLNYKLEGLRLP